MNLLNRYSYVLICSLIAGAGLVLTFVRGNMAPWGVSTLLFTALALIYFVAARRGPLTPANPEKRIRRAQGNGRPLVVCFYSDFHLGSLLNRPVSALAEKAARGRAEIIYIDVNHREGKEAARSLKAGPGVYLLYNGAGTSAGRAGYLSASRLASVLEQPARH